KNIPDNPRGATMALLLDPRFLLTFPDADGLTSPRLTPTSAPRDASWTTMPLAPWPTSTVPGTTAPAVQFPPSEFAPWPPAASSDDDAGGGLLGSLPIMRNAGRAAPGGILQGQVPDWSYSPPRNPTFVNLLDTRPLISFDPPDWSTTGNKAAGPA